ncbi:macro domain-containing protein [Paenibacillus polymyxa]|nr:macro domain-containing protein [Paenibacillus polymyxa]MDY8117328.1 macro domain-containing protein [Paenibacillus polymyxa]
MNVVHTVGPVWNGGDHQEEELLAKYYQNTSNWLCN